MDVVNETVLRNGEWFAEKPGDNSWENPWTQIGLNDDGIPIYILRAFEIANKQITETATITVPIKYTVEIWCFIPVHTIRFNIPTHNKE